MMDTLQEQVHVSQANMPWVVRQLNTDFCRLWWDCPVNAPDLGRKYSLLERRQKEKLFTRTLDEVMGELQRASQGAADRQAANQRVTKASTEFARIALGLEDRHIEAVRSYGFIDAVSQFIQQAHQYDPSLSDADIFQASRNVWSMNFMQVLMGLPVEITPSVFAYSLLYPYSDNYLDDARISSQEKHAFNQRFRRRLHGEIVKPASLQEEAIDDLIGRIEDQYPRSQFPEIFDSLLAIHDAQSQSVGLQGSRSPYEVDVLSICFEKGGTSVLADGYLVAGTLTPAEQALMYHYGAFTQLMDDLEDVHQDLSGGIGTVFSQTACAWKLDRVTNRAMHFGQQLLDRLDDFDQSQVCTPLRELLRSSFIPLMIALAGQAGLKGQVYSPAYLAHLQEHFPFGFGYLDKKRRRLERKKVSPVGLVEILATTL